MVVCTATGGCGGEAKGSSTHAQRSRWTKRLRRSRARRLERLQESLLRICRYFRSRMAIKCCPNLNAYSVGGGAHEGFDFEVLFEGLEKEFLPTRLVDGGNG